MGKNYLVSLKNEIPDLVQNVSYGLVPAELKPYVEPAMKEFRNEIATELGLSDYDFIDKGELPSRLNGKVGGNMVGKMVAFTEAVLAYHYKERLALKEKNE
ncbi:MAG: small, acid-soluble spore protein, alpha/beta type [Bacillota bacterium]